MVIFIIIVAAAIIGIIVVLWLLSNEKKTESIFAEMERESQLKGGDFLSKVSLETPQGPEKIKLTLREPSTQKNASKAPLKSHYETLKERLGFKNQPPPKEAPKDLTPPPPTGTASIRVAPVPEDTSKNENLLTDKDKKALEEEINVSLEYNELKEKYEKLDQLFKEKSAELDKSEKALNNELKIRKEFNKVKDILEKELKDTKDKCRDTEVKLNNSETENEGHKKRIGQLEEKVNQLQKELLSKESKIDELVKRLQTFASPTTASTPPVREGIQTPVTDTTQKTSNPEVPPEPPHETAEIQTPSQASTPKEPEATQEFLSLKEDVLANPSQPSQEPTTPEPENPQTDSPQTAQEKSAENSPQNDKIDKNSQDQNKSA